MPPPSVIWQVNVPSFSSVKWSIMNSMIPVETSCPILLGCRQIELCFKKGHTHLMMDFVDVRQNHVRGSVWQVDSQFVHLGDRKKMSHPSVVFLFFLFHENNRMSYISAREFLVVCKEFVGDIGGNLFSLQPEPHPASLQNLIG